MGRVPRRSPTPTQADIDGQVVARPSRNPARTTRPSYSAHTWESGRRFRYMNSRLPARRCCRRSPCPGDWCWIWLNVMDAGEIGRVLALHGEPVFRRDSEFEGVAALNLGQARVPVEGVLDALQRKARGVSGVGGIADAKGCGGYQVIGVARRKKLGICEADGGAFLGGEVGLASTAVRLR